jgi:prophage regulatory protein
MIMVQTILRRPDVERATGLPRSTIYEMMAAGRFPKPVLLGARSVGWLEAEVDAWQKDRISRRDRKIAQTRQRGP